MALYADDRHKRASNMLGYSLTIGTTDAWAGFGEFIVHRLTKKERVSLLWAALHSLDHDTAYRVASLVLYDSEVAA